MFSERGSVLFHFKKKKEIIKRFSLGPSFLESPCLGDFFATLQRKAGIAFFSSSRGTYSNDLATATGGGVSVSLIRIQLIEQMKWCGKENRKRQCSQCPSWGWPCTPCWTDGSQNSKSECWKNSSHPPTTTPRPTGHTQISLVSKGGRDRWDNLNTKIKSLIFLFLWPIHYIGVK